MMIDDLFYSGFLEKRRLGRLSVLIALGKYARVHLSIKPERSGGLVGGR